jgi:acetate kinase
MKIAVINCGSSSIKYEVFSSKGLVMLASGLIEKIGSDDSCLRQRKRKDNGSFEEHIHTKPLKGHREGFEFMAQVNQEDRIIKDESELLGIGHRVVHGGELFREPALIGDQVIAGIRSLIPLAPLHNPSNLLGIELARTRFPGVPQVAVFDTAFHHTLPPHVFHYAVPNEWYTGHHVRRYGFHGTSHLYVSREAASFLRKSPESVNIITIHLGNGASCAAVQRGKSVDTSMGMTPLEGLVMGTRSGDIDPSLPFFIMREMGMSADQVEESLNSQSGLLGICGVNDMREIEGRAKNGDERANLALEIFCYRIKKYIGAYCAILGRLDAIVFTGGIGENSVLVRSMVCSGMDHMGISLNEARNAVASGNVAEIQDVGAAVKVLVIQTDEEREIARQTILSIEKT